MMIVVVELLINFICISHITLWRMIVSNEQGTRFCEISSVRGSWLLLGEVIDTQPNPKFWERYLIDNLVPLVQFFNTVAGPKVK